MAESLRHLADPLWRVLPGPSAYPSVVAAMEAHVDRMTRGDAGEEIWLVEHDPVVTAGTSASMADLLQPSRFPVVIYPMLDLSRRGRDVRRYVAALEGWAIAALDLLGIAAGTSQVGTGIWVRDSGQPGRLLKIGAIGVRVRRWISFHGLALNVTTELGHFDAIVPCGISEHGVTRLADLRPGLDMRALDQALLNSLPTLLHSLSSDTMPCIKTLEGVGDCS
jgi:lipoyl(octanoyl) transferase